MILLQRFQKGWGCVGTRGLYLPYSPYQPPPHTVLLEQLVFRHHRQQLLMACGRHPWLHLRADPCQQMSSPCRAYLIYFPSPQAYMIITVVLSPRQSPGGCQGSCRHPAVRITMVHLTAPSSEVPSANTHEYLQTLMSHPAPQHAK